MVDSTLALRRTLPRPAVELLLLLLLSFFAFGFVIRNAHRFWLRVGRRAHPSKEPIAVTVKMAEVFDHISKD